MKKGNQKNVQAANALKDKRKALSTARTAIAQQEKKVSALMEKLMECDSSAESTTMLSERLEQLQAQLQSMQSLKNAADSNLKLAQQAKEKAQQELSSFVAEKKAEIEAQDKELSQFRAEMALSSGEGKQDISSVSLELRTAEKKLAAEEDAHDTALKRAKAAQAQLDAARKRINESQLERKNLDSNVKYRAAQAEVASYGDLIGAKEVERQKLGGEAAISSLEKQQKTAERLKDQLARLQGHIDTLKMQIKEIKGKIKAAAPEKIQKELSGKLIDLEATKLAIKDLTDYHTALDQALMKYHEEKMSEINGIIKDLWQTTYRGSDIDTIAILADAEKKGKKSHKYRVVMVKGDSMLDMRGRCSAGQKVLASLIIRLALAESFGLDCGILALDEPTTNLDRDNIESLAQGLGTILKHRRAQTGFQLLVITHDEEFVQMLGRTDYADHYYHVSKDDNAFSTLTKKDIIDLGL